MQYLQYFINRHYKSKVFSIFFFINPPTLINHDSYLILNFVHSKVFACMLHKHIILPERPSIHQKVNSLSCSKFSLQDRTCKKANCNQIYSNWTVLCCFATLFSPPPTRALLFFSSKASIVLVEYLHIFSTPPKHLSELGKEVLTVPNRRSIFVMISPYLSLAVQRSLKAWLANFFRRKMKTPISTYCKLSDVRR